MNRFYSNIHRVVARHCAKGGVDGVFRKTVNNYNPDTGEQSEDVSEYTFRALEFDYERYNSGESSVPGTVVERADKQYLIDPLTLKDKDGNVVWPSILPEKGDVFDVQGTTSTVVLIKAISPDHVTPVMLEVQTKR